MEPSVGPADVSVLAGLPDGSATFLLLFCRVGAVLMLLPAFSDDGVPMRIRLLIALGVAAGFLGYLGPIVQPKLVAGAPLAPLVISELMLGFALGSVMRVLFLAAAMAGSFISMQTGLSSAIAPDPSQGGQAPILSRYISLAALVACFAAGVHHLWLGAIASSYQVFPVGGLPPSEDFAKLLTSSLSHSMSLALSLAAPLMVYGIIFNVVLGVVSRVAPAIQVFFIFQPMQLLLGLGLTAAIFGSLVTVFTSELAAWTSTNLLGR